MTIRQEQLGGITILDEDLTGSVDFSDGYARNVSGIILNPSTQPYTSSSEGAVWLENNTLNFTDEDGYTVSISGKLRFVNEALTVSNNQTEFTLSQLPISNDSVLMFVNGSKVLSSDYFPDGIDVTYSGTSLVNIDDVEFYYPVSNDTAIIAENIDTFINSRVEPDSNDIIVWTMSDTSMPVVNTGTAGSSANLVTAGGSIDLGTNSGMFGRSSYIKPLAGNWLKTANSVGEFTGNQINVSCWVQLNQYSDQGTIGRIVTKAAQQASWSDPFEDISVRFTVTSPINTRLIIILRTTNGFYFVDNITDNLVVQLYQWHHLGFSYNGSSLISYVNGVPLPSVETTITGNVLWSSVGPGSGPWFVGSHHSVQVSGNREAITGSVQDIRVSTVARPESWWREVYSKGTGRSFIF
jgi:hypothetical protein